VASRDAASCMFVSRSGRRCGERGFLEFHHLVPYALGGQPTVDNIQLRCRAHNACEGEHCFGRRDTRNELVPGRVRSASP
jgi:5-methylcytosine-specific restriction endonuclease McrA